MAAAQPASKRVRKSGAAAKKLPSVKRGRVAKKAVVARRHVPRRAASRPARRTDLPLPPITEYDEASAARQERHGMIEEAIEPPPSRDGHDIERE